MKVAYNNCFGGFGLSAIGLTEFAKRKGIELTWYKQTGYKHNNEEKYVRVNGIPDRNSFSDNALTKDLGAEIESIPNDEHYYPSFYGNDSRCDKDLIEVIELLGDKASGECASLAIEEIPDGKEFEIDEYDGSESVVPPRQSW